MTLPLIAFTFHLGPLACPVGWFLNGESCYKVSDTPETWSGADQDCKASGGNLARVGDHDEQRFLVLYLRITGLKDVTNVSSTSDKHSN